MPMIEIDELNKIQPQRNIELQTQLEQELLSQVAPAGAWEAMTEENFPLFSRMQRRAFFLEKLGLITEEVDKIDNLLTMSAIDEGTLSRVRGRLKELSEAAAETITTLYPDVEPLKQAASVTEGDFRKIGAMVETGSIEQLNEKNIPGWDLLPADQRLLFRLNALAVYYGRWKDMKDVDVFKTGPGFNTGQEDTVTPKIREVATVVKRKIVARYLEEWLKEAEAAGITADDQMFKTAKELVKSTKE